MDDTQPNGFEGQRETQESTPLKAIVLNALQTQTSLKINELYEICRPILPSARANQTHDSWLFEINFLLMNALFELQTELLNDGLFLDVDAMQLQLLPLSATDSQAIMKSTQSELRAYYLDWRNLELITPDEIDTLLNGFWQRYLASDKQAWALTILGLDEGDSKSTARAAYRRLAGLTHPDRGGNPEEFLKVREAWEILSRGAG
jgi:hypothetical protein